MPGPAHWTRPLDFEAQKRDLEAAGIEKLFSEQVSSVAKREQLEAAIAFARHGDVFVVTKLDRLARSLAHLLKIVERLRAKASPCASST